MDMKALPPPGGRPASNARLLDQVRRYKKLLGAYWWVLVITTALGVGVGWMVLKDKPRSFISIGRMTVTIKLALPNTSYYADDLNTFFDTQVEFMRSLTVQNRVSERLRQQYPRTQPVPVNLSVTLSPRTSIFNLRAEGTDPGYVHAFLQATMEEYVKLKRELLENASSATTTSFEKERDLVGAQLKASQQAVFDYQSSNSVVFLQKSGGNDAADYLATLNRQLTASKSELQLLQTLTLDENLERRQGGFGQQSPNSQNNPPRRNARPNSTNSTQAAVTPSSDGSVQPAADDTPAVNLSGGIDYSLPNGAKMLEGFEAAYLQAKQQIVLLKARKEELSKYMRPKHPDIIDLDEEIGRQQRLLAIFQEQSREQLTNHQHVVEAQIKELEAQVKVWEAKAVDSSKKLSEFEALQANAKRLQTIYDQLQASLQTLDVNKGIGQESVAIFEPASPGFPVASKLPLEIAMAGFVGLILGLGILLLRNQLDDRPSSLTELEDLLGEPVLGQIPLMTAKDKKIGVPLIQMHDDRHLLVESYSNLRSALLFSNSPSGQSKSIVITSAAPGDGKSMVCANLAISLAHTGARVLLVDADLRRGQMHRRFSIPEHPGLAEVLAEKCAWSEAVVHTSVPNLDLLPCGKPPVRPASLLISRTKNLLEQMAGRYDYYLFDSAPVMAADDVSSLAPQLDGVLMVIRAGTTYGRLAKSALDLLYLRKVNVIGLVFNGVSPNTKDYGYYHYKEYFVEASTQA